LAFCQEATAVTASKILWGQVIAVFLIVLLSIWSATQWTAASLGFQAELGTPRFTALGHPIYSPPSFFWWWFSFDAYAPHIFLKGAYIAASGSFASIVVAIAMSVWRGGRVNASSLPAIFSPRSSRVALIGKSKSWAEILDCLTTSPKPVNM
jgi:type IV secretory pathway TraG/TraD family ATPase VirD4